MGLGGGKKHGYFSNMDKRAAAALARGKLIAATLSKKSAYLQGLELPHHMEFLEIGDCVLFPALFSWTKISSAVFYLKSTLGSQTFTYGASAPLDADENALTSILHMAIAEFQKNLDEVQRDLV